MTYKKSRSGPKRWNEAARGVERTPRRRDDRESGRKEAGAPRRDDRGGDKPKRREERDSAKASGDRRFKPAKPHRRDGKNSGFDERSHQSPELRHGQAQGKHEARPERLWIYGRHAVEAAILNPRRKVKRVLANESAMEWLASLKIPKERDAHLVRATQEMLDRALHEGAVHQGVAVEVEDLPRVRLREACQPDGVRPVVVLDQITDPHNIGAIFRSAAAFGARAIIVQERRTPPLAGALAKAAAGAVEIVPCVPVVNVARALEGLKSLGYFCAGLAGEAAAPISSLPKDRPVALVLGAEGAGLRKLVRETCDGTYFIPIARGVDSLNVSNAAAVALFSIAARG